MPINKKEITKEQIEKAMQCKADVELDGDQLKSIAGGYCWQHCDDYSCKWDYEYI